MCIYTNGQLFALIDSSNGFYENYLYNDFYTDCFLKIISMKMVFRHL